MALRWYRNSTNASSGLFSPKAGKQVLSFSKTANIYFRMLDNHQTHSCAKTAWNNAYYSYLCCVSLDKETFSRAWCLSCINLVGYSPGIRNTSVLHRVESACEHEGCENHEKVMITLKFPDGPASTPSVHAVPGVLKDSCKEQRAVILYSFFFRVSVIVVAFCSTCIQRHRNAALTNGGDKRRSFRALTSEILISVCVVPEFWFCASIWVTLREIRGAFRSHDKSHVLDCAVTGAISAFYCCTWCSLKHGFGQVNIVVGRRARGRILKKASFFFASFFYCGISFLQHLSI